MTAHTLPLESSSPLENGEFLHDPAGESVQFHELANGDAVMTFSDEFRDEHDWREGDEIVLDPEQAGTGLFIRNISAEQRKASK